MAVGITTVTYTPREIRAPGVDESLYVKTPVTIGATQTVMRSGTVLGRKTSDGKYYAYNDGHSDGTEVAIGLLVQDNVDPAGAAGGVDVMAAMYLSGWFLKSQLTGAIGLDAAAITDLAGVTKSLGGSTVDLFVF